MSALQRVVAMGVPALVGAAIVYFGFGSAITGSQLKYYAVELETGSAGVLEVKKGNECSNGKHKGCLDFAEDRVGLIRFYLKGNKNKIRNCDNSSVDAVITRIELTTTGESDLPDDEKGDYSVDPDPWLREDAFPGVQTDGVVYEELPANARTQAWLVNLNSHDASEGPKPFWYKITATACEENDDGTRDTWITDPRGDNRGTN